MSTKEVFPKAEKWLPLAMTPLSLLTKKAPHSFYLPSATIITNRRKRDRASFANKSILLCGIMIEKSWRTRWIFLANFGQCILLKNLRTSCHKTAFKKVFICSSNSRKNFFKAPIMVASPFCKVCFIMD